MRQFVAASSKAVYDVIVIGGGHAGCEAATAAARMGCNTLLMTHRLDTIGEMSCNPSFGGIGKGHLMREIDALDGVCARICDISGCHYKTLNRSKGPAVYGLRAQIDRKLYKNNMQKEISNTPNLTVRAGAVENLYFSNDFPKSGEETSPSSKAKIAGIILDDNSVVESKTVIITTGTFLKGEIFMGLESRPAGRIGDPASYGLSKTLDKLGFRLGRLKTGTPPRLDRKTINFKVMTEQKPDEKPIPFSFLNDTVWIPSSKQLSCYLTHSNETVASIIKNNVHLNLHVQMETQGPRYCPSLESKILRFGEGKIHQFFMEPEGYDSPLTYPQGMSMTFPPEIQQKIINAVCGLENAVVTRPGYGVHYDFVDPRQLKPSLETKLVCGLFLAGQINGTTGYEEAAAQGIVAGMNAACAVQEKDPFVMNRSHGYIGVLIDDLTSLGTSEPYRMFTSRVEFRLLLRPDNADLRLTAEGYKRGVVGQKRFDEFSKTKKRFYDSLKMLTSLKKTKEQWSTIFPGCFHGKSSIETQQISGLHLIVGYNNSFDNVFETLGGDFRQFIGDEKLQNRLAIESMYRHSVRGAASQVKAVQQEAAMSIPDDFDFDSDQLRKCVSFECVEKLILHRPTTIGAASRIPGMTPASLFSLFLEVKKRTMQLANVGNVAEVDI